MKEEGSILYVQNIVNIVRQDLIRKLMNIYGVKRMICYFQITLFQKESKER